MLINGGNIYARTSSVLSSGKKVWIRMHKMITKTDKNIKIDHKDNNGLNNQESNLRIATAGQNGANCKKRKNNKSGFKGVVIRRKKFIAQIHYGVTQHYLGTFNTANEAARAYDKKAKEVFGEFANLNFPNEREIV